MLPDNSRQVEHGCLQEENEDDPLVVLVVHNLLTGLERCYARMRIVLSNLMWAALPIFLTAFPPSGSNSLSYTSYIYYRRHLLGTENVECIQQ